MSLKKCEQMCDEETSKLDSELEVGSDLDISLNVYLE